MYQVPIESPVSKKQELSPPLLTEEHTINSQHTKLTYTASGDYFIPKIAFSVAATENLGKYGQMRKTDLQEHRPCLFNGLILSEKRNEHCTEINAAARQRIDLILPRLAEAARATENLKIRGPLKWVGLLNTCKAQAEEVILNKLVYD